MTEEEQKAFDDLKKDVEKLSANNTKLTDELKAERDAKRTLEAEASEKAEAAAKAAEEKARAENNVEELEKTWKEKLDAVEARAYDAESKYEGSTIDRALTAALAANKVPEELRGGAALVLKNDAFPEIGDDGSVTVDGKPLTDYVAAWAETDAGKPYVASGSSGGGAGGGAGGQGGGSSSETKGDMGGNKAERTAAIAAKYPDLEPTN